MSKLSRVLITDLTYVQIVPAGTGVMLTQTSPFKGRITEVTMQFPPGCNSLVEIVFGVRYRGGGYKSIIPYEGLERGTFIALDEAIKPFRVDEEVRLDQVIFVQISNTDAINPHTPSVIVELENEEGIVSG